MATAGLSVPSGPIESLWERHKKKWICGTTALFTACVAFITWASFAATLDTSRVLAFFTGMLALATFVAATTIAAAFMQVREGRKALRDNRAWNRMNAAMTFMPRPDLLHRWESANNDEIYSELEQFCDKLSPKRSDPGPVYPVDP